MNLNSFGGRYPNYLTLGTRILNKLPLLRKRAACLVIDLDCRLKDPATTETAEKKQNDYNPYKATTAEPFGIRASTFSNSH
jgi:hypothetical protein